MSYALGMTSQNQKTNSQSHVVARESEIADGETLKVEIDDEPILLARVDGEIHAVGARCTHWGGPLEEGLLDGHTVMCPWHHACFDVRSGAVVDRPARNPLACYDVEVIDGDVVLTAADDASTPNGRDPDNHELVVIVGAGAAGNTAAETLRDEGYGGRIVMITRESELPYDRPNLSKDYLAGDAEPEWIPLRDADFYEARDIELWTDTTVISANLDSRRVTLSDGTIVEADKVLIATGGVPRRLGVPGHDLDGVMLLRSFADAQEIVEAAEDSRRAVIVGSGFIGLECAASLRKHDVDVTVVSIEDAPMGQVFGEEIGRMLQELHTDNGVAFHMNTGVERFEGDDSVSAVVLDDGTRLDADLVLVGIGVTPATEVVRDDHLIADGTLEVDRNMEVQHNVFAAGDVARFEDARTGRHVRVEHWRVAEQQGRIAALSMMGNPVGFEAVPFFWTRQYDTSLKMIGFAPDWDDIIFDGTPGDGPFLAFYEKDDEIHAVAARGRSDDAQAIERLMQKGKMPSAGLLRSEMPDWQRLLRT